MLSCLMVVIVLSLSNFVWNIDITGNNTISNKELIETLKQEGLKIGVLKNIFLPVFHS